MSWYPCLSGAATQGDLLLLAAGPHTLVHRVLDRVRQYLAKELKLIDPKSDCLLWVTDFPMFEWNEEEGRLEALHHPFTAPNPRDLEEAKGELRGVRALAYDMVYNGVEIGGGSLRIYRWVGGGREERGAGKEEGGWWGQGEGGRLINSGEMCVILE